MSPATTSTSTSESVLERAHRIRDFIEQTVQTLGEHPECELKLIWRRDTLHNKAEFIKDIQAIANSAIPEGKDKFIVVGANQTTKEIEGCNHADFDDADIRPILENHLDPVPEFEVLCLQSSRGKDFVVLRIPSQPGRPFVVKASIQDTNKKYLEEGQVWIKPGGNDTGSSGKRLLKSRSELVGLVDIEPYVKRAVSERIETLLPQIRLEERTRLQSYPITSVSALTSSDEEFESYIEQLLAAPNQNQLNIIIEKLRERTVEVWDVDLEPFQQLGPDDIRQIKEKEFLPALRRLVLTGLLLIKFSAPAEWFVQVANLLHKIFDASKKLKAISSHADRRSEVATLDEHLSFSVPALESLIAAYLLSGYELSKREGASYMRANLNRIVKELRGPGDSEDDNLYMFWPVTTSWGAPHLTRYQMAIERYANGDRIEKLLGRKEGIKAATIQIDCLIDWHSFLGFEGYGEPETVKFYRTCYPQISTYFHPNYTFERYEYILPVINKLWATIHTREKDYWLLDSRLADSFALIDLERRKKMLARFLLMAEQNQSKWMWANNRFPYDIHWPQEIREAVSTVRAQVNNQKTS